MVKKLFKHEFYSYLRIMSIIYIVLLSVSAFTRIIQFFESENTIFNIVNVFTLLTYIVSIITAIGFATVLSIVRFYKNLFTREGYLTFTLPVTTNQHLLVKSVTAVSIQALTFIFIIISVCIATAGDVLNEILNALKYIFGMLKPYSSVHLIAYMLEFILLLFAVSFMGVFLYYLFISIGQLFRKNRILAAFGAYFVYYIINQIISTIFVVLISIYGERIPMDKILAFAQNHQYLSVHIILLTPLTLTVIFTLVYFIFVRFIINKRLNLE